ncbi:hypothetical protein AP20H10_03350 [Apilactobacillus apinorum]|uniref:Uncharacterized protein n=1 Tax=Apilactobacillus apinorum TaxID=1218495 RepID=A0ABP9ZGP8_9LACO
MTSAEWQLSTMEFILGWLFAVPTTIFVMERKEKFADIFKFIYEILHLLKQEMLKKIKKSR